MTKALRGIAALGAPEGCPVLSAPEQLLGGTTWSFHTESASFQGAGQGRVGIFKPVFVPAGADPKNPAAHGILTATETLSYDSFPNVMRLAGESGRYSVYPDCSGGQIQIAGSAPATYDFVFVGAGVNRIFMLSDTLTGAPNLGITNVSDILGGEAKRF